MCLPQVGLNGVDNGAIRFTRVRVPRENLLDRFASVDRAGRYSRCTQHSSMLLLALSIGWRHSDLNLALGCSVTGLPHPSLSDDFLLITLYFADVGIRFAARCRAPASGLRQHWAS